MPIQKDTVRQARTLVAAQAEDEGLWFKAETAAEGYLQQELRKLHAAVEALTKETPMEAWQARVVNELQELETKLNNLKAFFNTGQYAQLSTDDKTLLRKQGRFMDGYADMLRERIKKFPT